MSWWEGMLIVFSGPLSAFMGILTLVLFGLAITYWAVRGER